MRHFLDMLDLSENPVSNTELITLFPRLVQGELDVNGFWFTLFNSAANDARLFDIGGVYIEHTLRKSFRGVDTLTLVYSAVKEDILTRKCGANYLRKICLRIPEFELVVYFRIGISEKIVIQATTSHGKQIPFKDNVFRTHMVGIASVMCLAPLVLESKDSVYNPLFADMNKTANSPLINSLEKYDA